jgi:hypothetical protein
MSRKILMIPKKENEKINWLWLRKKKWKHNRLRMDDLSKGEKPIILYRKITGSNFKSFSICIIILHRCRMVYLFLHVRINKLQIMLPRIVMHIKYPFFSSKHMVFWHLKMLVPFCTLIFNYTYCLHFCCIMFSLGKSRCYFVAKYWNERGKISLV